MQRGLAGSSSSLEVGCKASSKSIGADLFEAEQFLAPRRYASAGTSCRPVSVSVCLRLSLTSWCYLETAGRIELICARKLLSTYPTLCCKKIRYLQKMAIPSGTFSSGADFAKAYRS